MPNIDAPSGFEFVDDRLGGSRPRIRTFKAAASFASGQANLFIGQLVKLTATGLLDSIDGATFGNDSGLANGRVVGICQRKASVNDPAVPVILAQLARFRVQVDDDWTNTTESGLRTLIGTGTATCWGITNANLGNATHGGSIAELDGNSTPALANYLQIVDWEKTPGLVFGPFQKLIVQFNPQLFENSADNIAVT